MAEVHPGKTAPSKAATSALAKKAVASPVVAKKRLTATEREAREDAIDIEIGLRGLAEMDADPSQVVRGEELEALLNRFLEE